MYDLPCVSSNSLAEGDVVLYHRQGLTHRLKFFVIVRADDPAVGGHLDVVAGLEALSVAPLPM